MAPEGAALSTSEKIIAFVKGLPADSDQHDQSLARILLRAYCDAVRAEWQGWVDADPKLKNDMEVARQLMADAGYDNMDPICGLPGTKPMVAKVDNLETVSFEHSMQAPTMPLSAIFVNRVRDVREAAEKVATARSAAAASAAAPQEPPQK